MDETSQKIIDATMALVRDKGYVATTTKDIAKLAEVNECTLFRKFKSKKDIVLSGVEQEKWRGNLTPEVFDQVEWELQKDLGMFMREYMQRITPDFVRLSIGLRAPQIYAETQPLIKKIPEAFVSSLAAYLGEMVQRGKLAPLDQESAALTIFASTFGYTFLSASFAQELSPVEQERYIEQSAALFIEGLARP